MVQVQTTIWLDDAGMAASMADARPPGPVETQVFLDTLGTGELAEVELRYLWYAWEGPHPSWAAGRLRVWWKL